MSEKFIFQTNGLIKRYDEKVILNGITLSFFWGANIGVIGNNGAGKSTLLRIMAGEDKDFEGTAFRHEEASVGYVPQEPQLDYSKDVRGNVEDGVAATRALMNTYDQLNEKLAEPLDDDQMQKVLDKLAAVTDQIDAADAWELDRHVERAMHALSTPPGDADVSKLSGGEQRRVALCRTLLSRPDFLLLDEPTNHLDADSVEWLQHHLADYPGTVILITHDRYFLDNVVQWMLEIERGQGVPFKGNYSAYLDQKSKLLRIEKRREAARKKVLERELEFINQTPAARRKRNKARIRDYQKMHEEHMNMEVREEAVDLLLPPGPRLGDRVVTVENVTKSYGDRTLFENLSFEVPPGAIVGVIGANGTGKTTIMKIIVGELEPDEGNVTLGKTVESIYVDQSREALDDERSVFEEITDGAEEIPFGQKMVSSRAYVARFRFHGGDQSKKVGNLSGGQRNRVQMAKLLRHGANFLLLDEPTNDLDLQTLRVLEEALQSFPGSCIVVSHDRWFLNRVATHVLAFEGDGTVHFFEGDYDSYHDWKEARRKEDGRPEDSKAGKYRKL